MEIGPFTVQAYSCDCGTDFREKLKLENTALLLNSRKAKDSSRHKVAGVYSSSSSSVKTQILTKFSDEE
jgi:hypothetical protein